MINYQERIDEIKALKQKLADEYQDLADATKRFSYYEIDALYYYWRNDSKMKSLIEQLSSSMQDNQVLMQRTYENLDGELDYELKQIKRLQEHEDLG